MYRCPRMIAAFGSGAAFSLVSGMAGPQPLMGAFSTGVVFALLQGGLFKVCFATLIPHHATRIPPSPPFSTRLCLALL